MENNNRFFTVETEARRLFYQVPKQFMIKDSKYYAMTSDSKLLYGILSDRNSLSMKNNWIDQDRRIYFIMTLEELMSVTGWSINKVTKHLKELRKYELLISKQKGQGKPSWHYLLQVEVEEGLENQLYQQTHKISDSTITELVNQGSQDLITNNTNINNTDSSNTKKISKDKDNYNYNNIESNDNTDSSLFCSNLFDSIVGNKSKEEVVQVQEDNRAVEEVKDKTVVPDDENIDRAIKTLLCKDKTFKGIDFTDGESYMAFIESVVTTQLQDNVEVLSINQWAYFRNTLKNKLNALGILRGNIKIQ